MNIVRDGDSWRRIVRLSIVRQVSNVKDRSEAFELYFEKNEGVL